MLLFIQLVFVCVTFCTLKVTLLDQVTTLKLQPIIRHCFFLFSVLSFVFAVYVVSYVTLLKSFVRRFQVKFFCNNFFLFSVIQWLNKQLTFAQSRDPGLRLGPPPEFLATSTPLPAGSQYLRDLGMVTPKNQMTRSTDKEK